MSIDQPLSTLLDEIQEVMLNRHAKYGPKNISDSPGGPLNGLRTRLHDKLARINHVVDEGVGADCEDDSFRDAWVDVVGYGLIGLLVLDGDWPGVAREKPLEDLIEPRTYRWSELSDKVSEDWPAGTTFKPDPPSEWTWERRAYFWRTPATFSEFATLRGLIANFGYEDGTITEPPIAASRTKETAA